MNKTKAYKEAEEEYQKKMKDKEFNLTEKIQEIYEGMEAIDYLAFVRVPDIKEFIKIICEDCCEEATMDGELGLSQVREILDKRAGDKLITKEVGEE